MMVQEIKNFITPHQAKTELPYQPFTIFVRGHPVLGLVDILSPEVV